MPVIRIAGVLGGDAGRGYRGAVTGSVLLTTRGHVDLARVASALCPRSTRHR
ncbi:putative leader peptide [Pseudonocardia sp. ICBG1293]|uniref:putative leader peptide n=1 Tax=Pseudonocardia sp. ICBG1293 TaxID=2844382 RepID=UPI0035A92569